MVLGKSVYTYIKYITIAITITINNTMLTIMLTLTFTLSLTLKVDKHVKKSTSLRSDVYTHVCILTPQTTRKKNTFVDGWMSKVVIDIFPECITFINFFTYSELILKMAIIALDMPELMSNTYSMSDMIQIKSGKH